MTISIKVRLMLLYSACAFTTLVLVTLAMFFGLQKNIMQDEAHRLVGEMAAIGDLLGDPIGNASLLSAEVDPGQRGEAAGDPTYIRVRDQRHQILFETSGMSKVLPSSAFDETLMDGAPIRVETAAGEAYMLASAVAPNADKRPDHLPLIIEVAKDLSSADLLVASDRDDMLMILLGGSVLCAVVGYVVTRQGLKPLHEIMLAIKRIRAEQLHDRLHPGRWPSELTQLAIEFDQMLLRLEDSFGRLKQLSADLAHELRTPVHAMMGQTEVALSKPRSNGEYQALLESNLEEQGRLARLIDTLLFLARADSAQTALTRDRIDVARELDALIAYFDVMAQENAVRISREGSGVVFADRTFFNRAVSNLISNALRHTPRGGNIRLTADACDDGSMNVRVIDNGVGIAPNQLPRVFERFYRGDDVRESREGGAGLGLAIVRSIMTLHEGSVDIASRPHRGTTATLNFPPGRYPGVASATRS